MKMMIMVILGISFSLSVFGQELKEVGVYRIDGVPHFVLDQPEEVDPPTRDGGYYVIWDCRHMVGNDVIRRFSVIRDFGETNPQNSYQDTQIGSMTLTTRCTQRTGVLRRM